MFCPYILYLFIICYNSGFLIGNFMQIIEQMESKEKADHSYVSKSNKEYVNDRANRDKIRMQGFSSSVLALVLLFAFFSLELR